MNKVKRDTDYFYEKREALKNCRSESELLKVATDIDNNKKEYGFDDYQIDKLQQIGINRYDQIQRELAFMSKNKK